LGDVFGQNERDGGAAAGDRLEEDRYRPGQRDSQGAVVLHAPRVDELCHSLAERFPSSPPLQALNAILGADRLAIVELEAVAQTDHISAAVILDAVSC